jgi:hypothetical protein
VGSIVAPSASSEGASTEVAEIAVRRTAIDEGDDQTDEGRGGGCPPAPNRPRLARPAPALSQPILANRG